MNGLGLFLAIVSLLFIPASCLVFVRREHYFIKCRSPIFLITQNVGSMMCALLLSIYWAFKPNISCGVYFMAYVFAEAGMGVALSMRCWQYSVNYHISVLKAQYRESLFGSAAIWKTDKLWWLFTHKWVSSFSFLVKILIVIYVLLFVVMLIPFLARYEDTVSYNEQGLCQIKDPLAYTIIAIGATFVLFDISLATLIRKSRDAYHIKTETLMLSVLWIAALLIGGLFSSFGAFPSAISAELVLVVAILLTLLVSTIFPLFLSYRYDKYMEKSKYDVNLSYFEDLLQSFHFRNVFHDFLTKEFAQENLLFYEIVNRWKELPPQDPTKNSMAQHIYGNFILSHGVCQVNIEDDVKQKIEQKIKLDPIPDTIFDEVFEMLVNDMLLSSFRQFKSSDMYREALLQGI